MQAFTALTGLVAPLDRVNVDTDQIIPKQFLKTIKRTGLREGLFYDWRKQKDGSQDPAFFLNQPRFRGATILLTRDNFGCGSSREHAPWALLDQGFRCIIALELRRHLLQQLLPKRHAARGVEGRRGPGDNERRPCDARVPTDGGPRKPDGDHTGQYPLSLRDRPLPERLLVSGSRRHWIDVAT